MRTTKCDKCGMETTVRNPKCKKWAERLVKTKEYIDLCPKCAEEYDTVKDGAWRVFNATLEAWLGCVTNEPS